MKIKPKTKWKLLARFILNSKNFNMNFTEFCIYGHWKMLFGQNDTYLEKNFTDEIINPEYCYPDFVNYDKVTAKVAHDFCMEMSRNGQKPKKAWKKVNMIEKY